MIRPLFDKLAFTNCVCVLAAVAACTAESSPPAAVPVAAELQRVLDDAADDGEVLLPGAIAYYRDPGYTPFWGSAGTGDMEAGTPIRSEDRLPAGSIVKTFLATVALQHVEEGTLSLDQTLPELLPRGVTDRVKNADQISLRMLLNHTSGIPDWLSQEVAIMVVMDPTRVWSSEELLDLVAQLPAWFPPGSSVGYSNSNYTLLGMVLDRVGEGGWRAQVRARVIDRLDLRSTGLPEPGSPTVAANYVHGYRDVEGTAVDLTMVDASMAGAAGGNSMISTVQDLGRFLDALLDGQLFERPETLEAMTTMLEAESESGLPYAYGLGLESYVMPGGTKVIGHAGTSGGYSIMMFQLEDLRTTLVTAVNVGDLFTVAEHVFIPSLQVITSSAPDR